LFKEDFVRKVEVVQSPEKSKNKNNGGTKKNSPVKPKAPAIEIK